jgi:hypothetical protein
MLKKEDGVDAVVDDEMGSSESQNCVTATLSTEDSSSDLSIYT